MTELEPVIVQALVDAFVRRPLKRDGALKADVAVTASAIFLFAAGIVYLLIAFHEWIAQTHAPAASALLTGCAAVGLAVVAGVGLMLAHAGRVRAQEMKAKEIGHDIATTLSALTSELDTPIADNPRTSVLLASLAGYVVGGRMH